MKTIAKFFPTLIVCFCFGCQNSVRPAVDMSTCKIQPGHELIVIDGVTDPKGHEWDDAASVPFPKDGQAKFLWDDEGIYGYLVSNYPPSGDPDESVCVSMAFSDFTSSDKPAALKNRALPRIHLYITSPHWNDVSGRFTGIPPQDLPKAKFAVHAEPAQQALTLPWSAEFFVPWNLLTYADQPSHGTLFVHVYRITGERPSSFLKLELPEK